MSQSDQRRLARSQVSWTASRISDPVRRLRYLKSAAPAALRVSRWKSRKIVLLLSLLVLGLAASAFSLRMPGEAIAASPPPPLIRPMELAVTPAGEVWQVEKTGGFDTYSNGLRIENQYAVSHRPRAYTAFAYDNTGGASGDRRTDPVGIVYHTTESLQAPFEASQNSLLKRVGESLVDYVRRRRCYNFLIDRFGRVFRIVDESDAADHAGHSVWADDRYFYVNLNDSFLGVSFEAQTGAAENGTSVSAAQVRAAAMLTEMLRSRYKIPARNCVTHAQVSVNPSNMRIGYHMDWASSFPFEAMGLPDNYAIPSPAVALFGFDFDTAFEQGGGVRLAAGAVQAERELAVQATAAHSTPAAYRQALRKRFRKIAGGARLAQPGQE